MSRAAVRPAPRTAVPRKRGRRVLQSQVRPAPRPVKVPVSPRRMWKMLIGGFTGLAIVAACVWAMVAQIPERFTLGLANLTSRAGFVVRQVEISGTVNQPRLSIYREILSGGSDSMMLLDLPAIRERLRALPWVIDASIARHWPDRLEIQIVERKPAAVWQNEGSLTLIDRKGEPLPSDELERFVDLPQIVGPTAWREAAFFLKLMASEPDLADELRAATWVGDRRWDLLMKSGETLSLPEGPAAAAALRRFAAMNRETPLLGRGFERFDMRIPDKMVVRVSGETGATAKPRTLPAGPRPTPRPQAAPATNGANASQPAEVRI